MSNNVLLINPSESEFKHEDLCIGVKLEVKTKTKSIYGTEKFLLVYENHQEVPYNDVVSCFDSTLTTNYTNDSAINLIGIKQINIKYNSWYVPQVSMTMVDVRGKGLFNDLETNGSDSQSLMNCLFTFPYPEFYLTVKGVYGKAVKFRLTVQDVRSRFDSKEGNFIIDVTMVGSIYNMLTDIPMHFLLVSPIVDYEEHSSSDLGTFSNGAKVPTMMELYNNTIQIESQIDYTEHEADITQLKTNIRNCQACINKINFFFNSLKTNVWYNVEVSEEDSDTITIVGVDDAKSNWDGFILELVDVVDSINSVNDFLGKTYDLGSAYRLSEGDLKELKDSSTKESREREIFGNNVHETAEITIKLGNDSLIKKYQETLIELEDKLANKGEDLKNEKTSKFNENLGFEPTLYNFLYVVQQHLVNLNHLYKKLLDKISISDRVSNDYKLLNAQNNLKDFTLPPFPFLYNKSTGQDFWFSDINNSLINNLDEKNFIDAIVGSIKNIESQKKWATTSEELQDTLATVPNYGFPTLMSDLYTPKDERKNIYDSEDISFYQFSSSNDIPQALKNFLKKCFLRYFFYYHANDGDKNVHVKFGAIGANAFASIEAINFLKAIANKDKSIIEAISQWSGEDMDAPIRAYLTKIVSVPYDFKSYKYPFYMDAYLMEKDKLSDYANGVTNACFSASSIKVTSISTGGGGVQGPTSSSSVHWYDTNHCTGALTTDYGKYVEDYLFDDYVTTIKSIPSIQGYAEEYKNVFDSTSSGKMLFHNANDGFFYKPKSSQFDGNYDGGVRAYKPETTTMVYSYANLTSYIDALLAIPDYRQHQIEAPNCAQYINANNLSETIIPDSYVRYFLRGFFGELDNICSDLSYRDFLNYNNCGFRYMYGIVCFLYGAMFKTIITDERHKYNEFITFCCKYFNDNYGMYRDKIKKLWDEGFANKESDNGDYYEDWEYHKWVLTTHGGNLLKDILSIKVYFVNFTMTVPPIESNNDVVKGIMGVNVSGEATNVVTTFITQIKSLCTQILETNNSSTDTSTEIQSMSIEDVTFNNKNIYYSFKELYDRWKMGKIDDSYFPTIKLYNHLYEDIGDKEYLDISVIQNAFKKIIVGENDISCYAFLYELLADNGFTMVTLPFDMFNGQNADSMKDMFKTYSYSDVMNNTNSSEAIVGIYNEGVSSIPSIENDFFDDTDAISFNPVNFVRVDDSNKIPVINVKYGDMENRYFSDIEIGTQKPRVTAESIRTELAISEGGSDDEQKDDVEIKSGNLYKLNQQRSFHCKIKMLGCSQICPLEYFQINNIPMFNGGYLIDSVEHVINERGMVTSFSGYRVSKFRPNNKPKGGGNKIGGGAAARSGQTRVISSNANLTSEADLKTSKTYSKEKTTIIIDMGHHAKTPGKHSVLFNVSDMKDANHTPEVEEGGVLKSKYEDESGNLVSVFDSTKNIRTDEYGGETRYREYWGNRKLGIELERQLKALGCKVVLVGNKSVDATKGASYSTINKYDDSIVVALHSNAAAESTWGSASFWSIFTQNNMYLTKSKKYVQAPNEKDSKILGEYILKEFKDSSKNLKSKKLLEKVEVKNTTLRFDVSENGIFPLTNTKAPTVLIESFFHTNKDDVKFLSTKEGRQELASIYAQGIVKFLEKSSNSGS